MIDPNVSTLPPPPAYEGLVVAVRWYPANSILPDDRQVVVVTNGEGSWLTYRIDGIWAGTLVGSQPVTYWAYLPAGPQRQES